MPVRPGEGGDRTEISGVIQDWVAFIGGRGNLAEAVRLEHADVVL